MNKTSIEVIILAAGKGTRMGGDTPKVLLKLGEKPILIRILETLKELKLDNPIVVTGHQSEIVQETVRKWKMDARFVIQSQLLGTAHAVQEGLTKVHESDLTLVLFGDDSGLLKPQTISELISSHQNSGSVISLLIYEATEVLPLGGLKRDSRKRIVGISSQRELLESGAATSEVVCGVFLFDTNWLTNNIGNIPPSASSGEYPLPALIKMAADQEHTVNVFKLIDSKQWNSLNTPEEYTAAHNKI